MAQAILVKVITDQAISDSGVPTLWAVVTDDPEIALRIARDELPPGWTAELTTDRLSDETVKRLGLVPGRAWPI
jgi:hypothetical protein